MNDHIHRRPGIVFLLTLATCLAIETNGEPAPDLATDSYGGARSISGTPTGWFHVERIDGRWYFITPAGHGFFALGATHAIDCIKKDELNLFETQYAGNEAQLSSFLLQRFAEWGYNSAGYGALPAMTESLPYVAIARTIGPRSHSAGPASHYVDMFDPAVQRELRKQVRQSAREHVENRNCLGYVFMDLPLWGLSAQLGKETYMGYIRKLPAAAPGKRAYARFLQESYANNPAVFAATYGLKTGDHEGVATHDFGNLAATPQILRDDEHFLNRLAQLYYENATTALREVDPHHLILGDRFMTQASRTPDSVLATAAHYIDAISLQPMGTQTLLKGYIDHVHSLTGKPVLLADVNCVLFRPAKGQTDTEDYERAVGEHTRKFYLDAVASTNCIGLHRCTIRDYQVWDKTQHRPGILRSDDTPYPILSNITRSISREVLTIVYPQRTPR